MFALLIPLLFPQDLPADARTAAWQLHQEAPPSSAIWVQRWKACPQEKKGHLFDAIIRSQSKTDLKEFLQQITEEEQESFSKSLQEDYRRLQIRHEILPATNGERLYRVLQQEIARGWVASPQHFLTLLKKFPSLRSPLLEQRVAHGFPAEPLRTFQEIEKGSWTAGQRALAALLLLDSGNTQAQHAITVWETWVAAPLSSRQSQLLEDGLYRHVFLLNPQSIVPALENASTSALTRAWNFLLKAPAALNHDLLLSAAFSPKQPEALRSKAILILLRGQGEQTAQELLPLLRSGISPTLLQSLLAGYRSWVNTPGLTLALQKLLPSMRRPEAALAIELLLSANSGVHHAELLKNLAPFKANERKRIAQASWFSRQDSSLLPVYWSWTQQIASDWQTLARTVLREAIPEEEIANGYAERIANAPTLALRLALLKSLRMYRTDAALIVYADWLQSEEGRRHPQAAEMASALVPEEGAQGLFLSWWENQKNLTEAQLDWAAMALTPSHQEARVRLYQRWEDFTDQKRIPTLVRLGEKSTLADYKEWVQLLLDETASDVVRRMTVVQLTKALPASEIELLQIFPALLNRTKMSSLPNGPWTNLLTAIGQVGTPLLREKAQEFLEQLGAKNDPRYELRAAWYRGRSASPDPDHFSTLLQELRTELEALYQPLLADGLPDTRAIKRARPLFFPVLQTFEAHGTPSADALFLEILPSSAIIGSRELLWITQKTLGDSWPLSKAFLREFLEATEPRFSPLRENLAKESPLPFPLHTQAESFYQALEAEYNLGNPVRHSELQERARLAVKRWPMDRRAFLWSGWLHLAALDLPQATADFHAANKRSGFHPYTTLESRLGLSLIRQVEAPSSQALQDFLLKESQASALLKARLPDAFQPVFIPYRALLPQEE